MKYLSFCFLFLIILLASCKEDNRKRLLENQKETKKRELLFSNIEKGWVFYDAPINTTSEASVATWKEFRILLEELAKKPKKTIGAFQQKATAISKAAMELNNNIPLEFNKPQIKARIATVITKVRMMDLYIHLDKIPDEKVVRLIGEINRELASLQREMDKIVEKGKIPIEEGESDLKKMLDSTRAIPNSGFPTAPNTNNSTIITPQNQNIPRVE